MHLLTCFIGTAEMDYIAVTLIDGGCRIYRAPSLTCAAAVAARQPDAPAETSADGPREATAVNMANTVYMVNPAGDLSTTQATFEETFRQQHTWQVSPLA
jgi:hypothetical protein